MIYAEILAGGSGTRMGNTDLPKQFMMLGSKPIIIHTIEQFFISGKFDKILVCCPSKWLTYANDLIEKYFPQKSNIILVAGGSDRNETIMNGCKYIEKNFGLKDDDIIVTHDAVRPFITQKIIENNIETCKKFGATDTVISAIDTIVESKNNDTISSIPKRDTMYQGQTPQSFKIKELMTLYNELNKEEKQVLTDACKIYILKNKTVKLVPGEVFNIKITTMHDLKIANAILMERTKWLINHIAYFHQNK